MMPNIPRILVGLFVVLLSVHFMSSAKAAPHAKNPQECVAFTDLALTVASHHAAGIPRDLSDKALAFMYTFPTQEGWDLAHAIAKSAQAFIDMKQGAPRDYAQLLGTVCLSNSGNMDSLFGTES